MHERTDEQEHRQKQDPSPYRGVDAHYIDPVLPSYQGNPLIEALPPINTEKEAVRLLEYYSSYNEQDRLLPPELRLQLIQNNIRFLQPLSSHIRLEQIFSGMLRSGYVERNPFVKGTFRIKNLLRSQFLEEEPSTSPPSQYIVQGCAIVGMSGTGKKAAISAVLALYDQIINHSFYHDQPFTVRQLTWMKLECPQDGLLRGLCKNFFKEIDRLMGTNTNEVYVRNGSQSIDNMLNDMVNVAAGHCLGVLVINDVQNLHEAKRNDATRMLNFLVRFSNRAGIPVILVGTPKALPALGGELFHARRTSEQGTFLWDRMQEDEEWNIFTDALWRYQYLRQFTPLSNELRHVLYDESQGIADLAIKLYKLAQIEAITCARTDKEEVITKELLHSVAQDRLCLVQPFLNALRVGEKVPEELREYEDIAHINLEEVEQEAKNKLYNTRNEAPTLPSADEEKTNEQK